MTLATLPGPVDADLKTSMQRSLFGCGEIACGPLTANKLWLDDTSWAIHQPQWLTGSDELFEELRIETPWQATERPMYDRVVEVPRLIATIPRANLSASPHLETAFWGVSSALQENFSSVGLNYYRTGSDSVAWHRDRLGRRDRPTLVALLSVGSPRTLAVRPYSPHRSKTAETSGTTPATAKPGRYRWRLGHGDLLIMGGASQQHWQHAVPKERGAGPRISLAFRSRPAREGPHLP